MVTASSISVKHNTITTNKLFWNQYKYCLTCYIPNASSMRGLDRKDFEKRLYFLKNGRFQYRYTESIRPDREYSKENETQLRKLFRFFTSLKNKNDFKFVVEWNNIRIYTNTTKIIDRVTGRSELSKFKVTECDNCLDPDAVYLCDPQFKYRTYIKVNNNLDDQTRSAFAQLAQNNDDIKFCPSFLKYCEELNQPVIPWPIILNTGPRATPRPRPNTFFNTNAFIDHNDKKWEMMLNLISPGIVKKTKATKAKN